MALGKERGDYMNELSKILPSAYADKGIRTKPNPLGLSVSEAQRAFDELVLDVVIPHFNAAVEAQNRNNAAIDGAKVDKVENKGLSTNDFTNEHKSKVESMQSELDKKVDKVANKSLSDNNYASEDRNAVSELKKQLAEGRTLSSNDFTDQYVSDIKNKVDKVSGKGLSANDYTDRDKQKVSKIDDKADKNSVLTKDNTTAFVPQSDYAPATKKYVDDNIISGGVPQIRKINGHALSADITLTAEDVNAVSKSDKNKIADDSNGKTYILGIKNGGLYYKEV